MKCVICEEPTERANSVPYDGESRHLSKDFCIEALSLKLAGLEGRVTVLEERAGYVRPVHVGVENGSQTS
jgi:hypothetical protein